MDPARAVTPTDLRGEGILGDIVKTLRKHKVISRTADVAGLFGVPYARQVGSVARMGGFGTVLPGAGAGKKKKTSRGTAASRSAAAKKAADAPVMTDDERRKLVSTEQSLDMEAEPKIPTAIEGLETFSLSMDVDDEEEAESTLVDADSLFNLPKDGGDDEDEQP